MCGIAGWLDESQDLREKEQALCKMSESIKSRGPDEKGEYITKDTALLHRRLAVIDIENGKNAGLTASLFPELSVPARMVQPERSGLRQERLYPQ